jgi:SprT-like family
MRGLQQTSPEAAALVRRLARLGLRGGVAVQVHENHSVMVSLTRRGTLRVHRGYAFAPDATLRAILRFVEPRTPRAARRSAERVLLAFPVTDYVPPRPRPPRAQRLTPADRRLLRELEKLHARLNREFFGGELAVVPLRLSSRMRTRLGEVTLDDRGRRPVEIAISRRHARADLWAEVRHTLLHEMVHQWQAQYGLPVDHGPTFRRKAREVGVAPRAHRTVRSKGRAA